MKSTRILSGIAAALLLAGALGAATPRPAIGSGGITLTAISTGFNHPIGIDHHHPTNKVVMSVNYPSGLPYNFELVAANGTRSGFSTVSNLTDELKIATARDDTGTGMSMGGFPAGTLFAGTGAPGHVLRLSPDGATIHNPWIVLPGETGLLRGSLHVDRTGVFGGDLIVVTTAGGVWRISSAGSATKLAQIPTHLEGVATIPNESRYGPWAGKILIGAEGQARFYTVAPNGAVASYALGIAPEDIDLIPDNENFYGVDYAGAKLWGATAAQFNGMEGDILVAQESPGRLYRVYWNPGTGSFVTELLAAVSQWEHVTFSPAGVVEIPPAVPCPTAGGTQVNWKAPLSSSTTHSMPNGTNLPMAFQVCGPGGFIRDESVVVLVEESGAPGSVITAWVYGSDIAIDDGAMEYRQPFHSGMYGLVPGMTLEIQVYIDGNLAGTARVLIT